jgi:hypothetical protein
MLDIIGFKEVLHREDWIEEVQSLVALVEQRRSSDRTLHPHIHYIFISDTIIILAFPEHLSSLIWKVCQLQNSFLVRGYGLRGAITYGEVMTSMTQRVFGDAKQDVVYEGLNLFGKGYLRAYEIHENYSRYPRVIIDEDVPVQGARNWADLLVGRDVDGWRYVRQFRRVTHRESFLPPKEKARDWQIETMEALGTSITTGMSSSKDYRHREKWVWLQREFAAASEEWQYQRRGAV